MADEFEDGLKDLVSEQFKDNEVMPLRNETTGRFIDKDGKDIVENNAEGDDDVQEPADEQVNENEPESGVEKEDESEEDDEADEGDEADEDELEETDGKKLSQSAKLTRALRAARKDIAELKRERAADKAEREAAAAVPKKADGTAYTSADEYAKDKLSRDEKAPKKPDAAAKGADGKPIFQLGEFDDGYKEAYDDYLEARRDYLAAAKAEFSKPSNSAANAAPDSVPEELRTKIDTTISNGKKLFKDFDEKVVQGIAKNSFALTQLGAEFMVDSAVGPEMAYHLASNPKLSKEIADLPPLRQAARLGTLEDKLIAEKAERAKKAKRGSAAPEPIGRVRGGGGRETNRFDSENFEDVEKNWNAGQKRKQ